MAAEDAVLARRLDGCRVLLCLGLFGEVMGRLEGVGVDYMTAQRRWLQGMGVAVEVLDLATAAPVAENAARIAAVIAADARPALLVGHSKGGLDALAALVLPGVAARCRGFVALQSPFGGSPIADLVCGQRALHQAADRALAALRIGSGAGITDLTTTARAAWMAQHAAAIADALRQVPAISLATRIAPGIGLRDAAYGPLAQVIAWMGAGPSDGLVPLRSARLPGARWRALSGGHRALVAVAPGRDPVGVLRAALLEVLA